MANPLQYSCLDSSMDRGARWPPVHGVIESDMTERLTHTHTHTPLEFIQSYQTVGTYEVTFKDITCLLILPLHMIQMYFLFF